jgi:hypothetical protein
MKRPSVGLVLLVAGVLTASVADANLDDEIKSKACKSASDPPACEEVAEAASLAKHATIVKRVGKTLELTVGNGVLKLEDVGEDEGKGEFVRYRFFDYFDDIDHILIREDYYEGGAYSLVDRKYGASQKIDEVPIFSPDRTRFLTESICDAYCPYRLEIWQRHGMDWLKWSGRGGPMNIGGA